MKIPFALIFLFSVLGIGQAKAQASEAVFSVETLDYTTNKRMGGTYVYVYNDEKLLTQLVTDSLGKVSVNLQMGSKYKVVVGGEGKVDRFFYVDLKKVKKQKFQLSGRCAVRLFDAKPETDYSFIFENPITRFYFQAPEPELRFEMQPATKMAMEIERILKEQE